MARGAVLLVREEAGLERSTALPPAAAAAFERCAA